MPRSLKWTPASFVLCFFAMSSPLLAQESCSQGATLQGIAREEQTGVRLGFAEIHLRKTATGDVLRTRTDRAGFFRICGLSTGSYELDAALGGYIAGPVAIDVAAHDAAGNTILEIVLPMAADVIALDSIAVEARPRDLAPPGFNDFERRRQSGYGVFVLPEDIERRNPTRVTELLQQTGVTVQDNGQQIFIRRSLCGPTVYIDGVRVTHKSRSGLLASSSGGSKYDDPTYEAASAVNMVNPTAVRAIEVYRSPGETPSAYLDSNAKCGVILIWTWRGPRPNG